MTSQQPTEYTSLVSQHTTQNASLLKTRQNVTSKSSNSDISTEYYFDCESQNDFSFDNVIQDDMSAETVRNIQKKIFDATRYTTIFIH